MNLDSPILDVKGVGKELNNKLLSLGIKTIEDLIVYYPRKYEDYSVVTNIKSLKPGAVTIKAVIKQINGKYVRRGMHITEAVVSDDTGSIRLVWFNQPYRASSLKKQTEYYISGNFGLRYQRLSIINPSVELVSSFPINTARIVPIYHVTKGLTSTQIRKLIRQVTPILQKVRESLPGWLVTEENLISKSEALQKIHFPKSSKDIEKARYRLGFEEVFQLSLASLMNKNDIDQEKSIGIKFNLKLAKSFVSNLPFKLTDAQRKVTWQIYKDISKWNPMNRLVEGDVGSGKTVIATMSALMALKQNYQVAFMSPTEILARQHADTIYNLLKPLKLEGSVTLLVGSLNQKEKEIALKRTSSGEAELLVGTHALIQEKVDFKNLAMVIVDEQHRFGVEQRKTLMQKAGHMPHFLGLSATPIPRSLALTLFGEMSISIIDTKPGNRKQIITKICSPNSRQQAYKCIESELRLGNQAFVVCPLISDRSNNNASSVEAVFNNLSKVVFKDRKIGVIHGKMKSIEKNKIMQDFLNKKLDILVSTTVIEVGVDVPNATVIMIESADLFGLAQIHQLRGRVGRSNSQSYCYLMMSTSNPPNARMRALESTNDGFKLADLDLKLRGPGAIYGTFQHGIIDLRIAKLDDLNLIRRARRSANEFINKQENLLQYVQLAQKVTELRTVTNLN